MLFVLDQRGNGIKSRSWSYQISTGVSFATTKDYADMFSTDTATTVYVVPDSYSNTYTDNFFPSIKDVQSPDLTTIIDGTKCLGIKDCCHIRTWHRDSRGDKVFLAGIAVAQVTPADGHMFLWDMRKQARHTVACKRCTQHLLRPVMNNDHKDSHAPGCRFKTVSDGVRAPKRALTEVRLQTQFEKASGSLSQNSPVDVIKAHEGVGTLPIEKKQYVNPELSRQDLVRLLDTVGAVTTGSEKSLMTRARILSLI